MKPTFLSLFSGVGARVVVSAVRQTHGRDRHGAAYRGPRQARAAQPRDEDEVTTSEGSVTVDTSGTPPGGDGSTPIPPLQLRVEKVAFQHLVPYLVEAHYLHRRPSVPKVCFAVFYGWQCVGVMVYGQPVARLEDQETTLELNRFWLSDRCAKNSESRVLAVSSAAQVHAAH